MTADAGQGKVGDHLIEEYEPRDLHMAISENGAWVQDFLTMAVRAGFRPKADNNLLFLF